MPAGSQLRRLFFALWPPPALCERLERNTRTLVRDSGGRAIPAQNFHVTVAFLGEVPESCLTAVLAAAAATPAPGFTLALDRIETWHTETRRIETGRIETGRIETCSRSGVLVLCGLTTPPELATLVARLRNSLLSQPITLNPEVGLSPGVYRPHITLARNLPRARPVPGPQSAAMAGTETAEEAVQWRIEWPVSEFVLIDSIRAPGKTPGRTFGAMSGAMSGVMPGGSNYQVLGRWQLA